MLRNQQCSLQTTNLCERRLSATQNSSSDVLANPNEPTASELVRKALNEWGFKGIKLHPLFQAFLPNDDIVHPIMEEARKAKAPVLIHTGHSPFSLPWSVGEAGRKFQRCQDSNVAYGRRPWIVYPSRINTAKKYDNTYLETSAMPMVNKVKEAVDVLGKERVMYGSDTPFGLPHVEIAKMTSVDLTEDEFVSCLLPKFEKHLGP